MGCHKPTTTTSQNTTSIYELIWSPGFTRFYGIFGITVFWIVVVRILFWALWPYLRRLKRSNIWKPSPTNWAVVTGGTDGIGLAYCTQLAEMGYPVLVISRSRDKLQKVEDQLKSIEQCPEVRTLSFDFSINTENHYEEIEKVLDELPGRVDVLVNNVGVSFATADYFTVISKQSPALFAQMINVNVVSAIKMTELVFGSMIQENRGIVINVGSQSALNPIPLLALYSATKAYVDDYTQSLVLEARDYPGVIIQSVLPGFVSTKMSHLRPTYRVPTADHFVRSALARVGCSSYTYGYWWHSFIGFLYESWDYTLGSDFNSWLAHRLLSGYREKYYRVKKLKDTFLEDDEEKKEN